jgi:hypothetical protein
MSVEGAKNLVGTLEGRRRIYGPDVERVWTEITKREAGDVDRKTIQEGEEAQWQRLGALRAKMSRPAQGAFDTKSAKVPELRIVGGGASNALTPPDALRPVYINDAGWLASKPNISGQPDAAEILAGTLGLAKAIQQQYELNRTMPASIAQMDLSTKNKLVDRLIAASSMTLTRDVDTMKLRSAAFTALWSLGVSTKSEGSGARVASKIHGHLLEMTKAEGALLLALSMATRLIHPKYKAQLTASQASEAKEVAETRFNQKWPVDKIRDADGYVRWEHVSGEGEGFFRSFKANIQDKEILQNKKFRKVSDDGRVAELQVDFPEAVGGTKGIKMKVRENRFNCYDSAGEATGISVGAHSEIGEMQKRSADRAAAAGKQGTLEQPILVDVCAGLDRLDYVMDKLGVRPITTHDSSIFWKGTVRDEHGSFEGVRDSEDMGALVELLKGIILGETAKQIGDRFKRVIAAYRHAEPPNYQAGSIDDWMRVMLGHVDFDNDGRGESKDIHFDVGLRTVTRDPSRELELKTHDVPYDDLDGRVIFQAVPHLNTSTHYNTFMERNQSVLHKFVSGGFFDGRNAKALIRLVPGEMIDGRQAIQVQFNSFLAHMGWQGSEALTQYGAFLKSCDDGLIRGLDGEDRIIGALMLAAFRLTNGSNEVGERDSEIWKQLLEAAGLPTNLPYDQMAALIDGEHHDYSGNRRIIDEYKEILRADYPDALAALRQPNAGRKIFD